MQAMTRRGRDFEHVTRCDGWMEGTFERSQTLYETKQLDENDNAEQLDNQRDLERRDLSNEMRA